MNQYWMSNIDLEILGHPNGVPRLYFNSIGMWISTQWFIRLSCVVMEYKKWWDKWKSSLWFINIPYDGFRSKLVAQSTMKMEYDIKNQTLLTYTWKQNIDTGEY